MKSRNYQVRQDVRWGMVRYTEGHYWIDTATISSLQSVTQEMADKIDAEIPGWAQANPQVEVRELDLKVRPR